jgi:hypothetical protein
MHALAARRPPRPRAYRIYVRRARGIQAVCARRVVCEATTRDDATCTSLVVGMRVGLVAGSCWVVLVALSSFSSCSVGAAAWARAPSRAAALQGGAPNGHACDPGHSSSALPFCNASLSIGARVADLVGRMTVEEKVHLIAIRGDSNNTGVDRLGIPGYNWGIEILHGAGIACIDSHCPTILPVLANAAASFNRSAWHGMGAVISTEMRAANNANGITRPGSMDPVGVNGWGPNINVSRCVQPAAVFSESS